MQRLVLSALLVPLALVACGDATGPEDVTGTYVLQTVNGQPLPVGLHEDPNWLFEITGGVITLDVGTSCSFSITWQETFKPTGDVDSGTETTQCTYTVSGSSVTLDDGHGELLHATVSGETLTAHDENFILVFRK